jgi:hypothetical protein
VNVVMNLRFPCGGGNLRTGSATVSVSKRTAFIESDAYCAYVL